LGPNILLGTLFSKTLSLHSSLNASDQVSHPYRTNGKIIVLYMPLPYLCTDKFLWCDRLTAFTQTHVSRVSTVTGQKHAENLYSFPVQWHDMTWHDRTKQLLPTLNNVWEKHWVN
jgi:hypothetical protein